MPVREMRVKDWVEPIQQLRETLGYKQEELADALGVTQGAVSLWENGRREPDKAIYVNLWLLAYDTPVGEFFWRKSGLTGSFVTKITDSLKRQLHNSASPIKLPGRSPTAVPTTEVPEPVAIPVVREASTLLSGPRPLPPEKIERLMLVPRDMCPRPEMTRCIRISAELMSIAPLVETEYIVAIDVSVTAPRELHDKLAAVMSPDGKVSVRWVRKAGSVFLLIPQHSSAQAVPIALSESPEWRILGRILFWIGQPK